MGPSTLRTVLCVRCGRDTGIPGAAYCDPCRDFRNSGALLTDADRERMAMQRQAICMVCRGEARSVPGQRAAATIKHRGGCEWAATLDRLARRKHRLDHDNDPYCICGGLWVYYEPWANATTSRQGVYGCERQSHADAIRHNALVDHNDRLVDDWLIKAIDEGTL